MKLDECIKHIYPDAIFTYNDENYSTLEWLDDRYTKPTKEQLDEINNTFNYKDKRKKEYPPLADQLDAIWKGEPHISEMRSKILDIKNKYTKEI